MCLSLFALFGSNNNNASHCTRSIDRGGRPVFQYLEAFDVVGVQACDSR